MVEFINSFKCSIISDNPLRPLRWYSGFWKFRKCSSGPSEYVDDGRFQWKKTTAAYRCGSPFSTPSIRWWGFTRLWRQPWIFCRHRYLRRKSWSIQVPRKITLVRRMWKKTAQFRVFVCQFALFYILEKKDSVQINEKFYGGKKRTTIRTIGVVKYGCTYYHFARNIEIKGVILVYYSYYFVYYWQRAYHVGNMWDKR